MQPASERRRYMASMSDFDETVPVDNPVGGFQGIPCNERGGG